MLPAASRMRRGDEFTLAVRQGRRAGSRHLAVHLAVPFAVPPSAAPDVLGADLGRSGSPHPDAARPGVTAPKVGLVVSKAVGNAVTRTRVKRRLRAVAASRLDRLPPGALAVLRANPLAADASSAVLGADLDRVLDRVLRPQRERS